MAHGEDSLGLGIKVRQRSATVLVSEVTKLGSDRPFLTVHSLPSPFLGRPNYRVDKQRDCTRTSGKALLYPEKIASLHVGTGVNAIC